MLSGLVVFLKLLLWLEYVVSALPLEKLFPFFDLGLETTLSLELETTLSMEATLSLELETTSSLELETTLSLELETMLSLEFVTLVDCLLLGETLTPGGTMISTWEHHRLWSGSWDGCLKCIGLQSGSQVSQHSIHVTFFFMGTGTVLQTGTTFGTQVVCSSTHWVSTLSSLLYQISFSMQSQ